MKYNKMSQYVIFLIGAIIFFTVGIIFAYLDTLFQDEFTQNENVGRGFWTTVSLIVIAVAALIVIHVFFVESRDVKRPSQPFLNIHQQEVAEELPTGDAVFTGDIGVGV